RTDVHIQLRKGVRYSNGTPVRPDDFRRTAERAMTINGPQAGFEALVGAATCASHPRRCNLSRGVVTDAAADTVTFHLVAPDPEFLAQLAAPSAVAIPAGTPMHRRLTHPLPATGPYEITSYQRSREVKLVRNPYFHEWSAAAQPDGYANEIVWKIGAST